jgi:hypothetical protein
LQELRAHLDDNKMLNLIPCIDAHEVAAMELVALLDKRTDEAAQKSHLKVRDTRPSI